VVQYGHKPETKWPNDKSALAWTSCCGPLPPRDPPVIPWHSLGNLQPRLSFINPSSNPPPWFWYWFWFCSGFLAPLASCPALLSRPAYRIDGLGGEPCPWRLPLPPTPPPSCRDGPISATELAPARLGVSWWSIKWPLISGSLLASLPSLAHGINDSPFYCAASSAFGS
jgi:hypothetical protein